MMKYLVIEEYNTDGTVEEFETKEEALTYAEEMWNSTFESDKKRMKAFYVLESVNPDEEAPDHYDGNQIKKYM